jgi:hypothetical protein
MENPETKTDLWVLPLWGDRKPTPFLRTEFNERSGQFSPDGHWIASPRTSPAAMRFTSESSPPALLKVLWDTAGKWLISKRGGTNPRWRGDGRSCSLWLPTGSLCQSTSAPSRYLRQERRGLCFSCRLVLVAPACLWHKAFLYPLR